MKTQSYDLIGDIHGQYEKLTALLSKLGYQPSPLRKRKHGESRAVPLTWKHPEGRKVIFLGDYIDRGPNVREVLLTVRGMVEEGDALAIMGNHEYNAVCYYTPDGNGGYLRPHTERNQQQTSATRGVFEMTVLGYGEWPQWLEWMKQLPLFLDLGGLRCVHACWDVRSIQMLHGESIADEAFLHASATPLTQEHRAVEIILKGPELPTSEGNLFRDKEGTYRHNIRVCWWDIKMGLTISDLVMPPGSMADEMKVDPWVLSNLPNYSTNAPPVFIGHYWLPGNAPKEPLAPNIACLDFSAGLDGPLVAYRWDGEQTLSADKFVVAQAIADKAADADVDVPTFVQSARSCAMQMMSNVTYIQKELPSLDLPPELHARVETVCGSLLGTKHGVITELFELVEIIEKGGSTNERNKRMARVVSWLLEPIQEMDELLQALGKLCDKEPRFFSVYLLLIESATNILNVFNSINPQPANAE